MPKAHKEPEVRLSQIRESFMAQAGELWTQHEDRFMGVLSESEDKVIALSFRAKLDFSESSACLETTIGYSQVVKDKRTASFDDPSQPALPFGRDLAAEDEPTPDGFKEREAARKGKGRRNAVDVEAQPV